MSLINTAVQPFKTQAFHNGKFIEVTEASLKGKWSVMIFNFELIKKGNELLIH